MESPCGARQDAVMQDAPLSVSIVLPCLNEAATVGQCVDRARECLNLLERRHGIRGEVIVADNGSTDGSVELSTAHGARVVRVAERGYGRALQGGMSAASGTFLVMGDCDCSYDFLESAPMVEALMRGADVCIGSRFQGRIQPGAMPWKNRYIGNPLLSAILRGLFRLKISDAHCGLRALTRSAFDRLRLTSNGMEFASEMMLKSALMGMNIAEVPVTLWPDKRGRPPHLKPWRDGFRHLFYMLMLSPTWLFLVPSAILAVFGLFIFAALLIGGDAEMVRIGNFGIGDHWAVVASSALIIAVQTVLFGLVALLRNYQDGIRLPTANVRRLLMLSRLQYWAGGGVLLMLLGLAGAITIATGWISSDFGTLNAMRELIASFTSIVVGAQLFFGGFVLSIISGNRSRHTFGKQESPGAPQAQLAEPSEAQDG
jgi:glycosyltransferase involved in cell wall biosynthesis